MLFFLIDAPDSCSVVSGAALGWLRTADPIVTPVLGCRRWRSSWIGRTWRAMRPRPTPSLASATRLCSRWRAPACCPAFSDGTGPGSQILLFSGVVGYCPQQALLLHNSKCWGGWEQALSIKQSA